MLLFFLLTVMLVGYIHLPKYREDGNREEEMIVAEDGRGSETNYL